MTVALRGHTASARISALAPPLWAVLMLAACNDRPAARSLKDEASSFRLVVDAPVSGLRVAGSDSSALPAVAESSFGVAGGQASMFRAAEVAPDRVALTTSLLSELKARQQGDKSIVIDLPADILFDFDKANLRADAEPSLRKAADLLQSYPDAPLLINGHTDAKGSDAYNDPLSLRRAQAVATWLKVNGGRGATVAGLGERRPVGPNTRTDGTDDPDGRQRNRRVEIVIQPIAAGGQRED